MSGVESVVGAVRTVLVSWDHVGGRVFRDRAPSSGATFPYVVLTDLSMATQLAGDSKTMAWGHPLQVSLWQKVRDESRSLVAEMLTALDGAGLTVSGAKIYGCQVSDTQRIVDPDGEVVQDAVTLQVRHNGATV